MAKQARFTLAQARRVMGLKARGKGGRRRRSLKPSWADGYSVSKPVEHALEDIGGIDQAFDRPEEYLRAVKDNALGTPNGGEFNLRHWWQFAGKRLVVTQTVQAGLARTKTGKMLARMKVLGFPIIRGRGR